MAEFEVMSWTSRDGLTLKARDHGGDPTRLPVVCLPGLTRNARDFAALAARIAPSRRVICPNLRGRGSSAHASDSATYNPAQYLDDILVMLEAFGIDRFIAVGTSLGGILTMLLASVAPGRIAGAVLNDIGPEIDPAGLERIRGYVGKGQSFDTWTAAAHALEETNRHAFPDYGDDDWRQMARRTMAERGDGRIVFDYDVKIAEPFATPEGATPAADMWPMFDALAPAPLLVVHGALSDILSADTAARMAARRDGITLVTLPRTGHTPTLDEPVVAVAIDRLLAGIA